MQFKRRAFFRAAHKTEIAAVALRRLARQRQAQAAGPGGAEAFLKKAGLYVFWNRSAVVVHA